MDFITTTIQAREITEQIKQEYGVDEVIKLASNENVYGCSPKVHHAVMNALAESAIYQD